MQGRHGFWKRKVIVNVVGILLANVIMQAEGEKKRTKRKRRSGEKETGLLLLSASSPPVLSFLALPSPTARHISSKGLDPESAGAYDLLGRNYLSLLGDKEAESTMVWRLFTKLRVKVRHL